MSRTALMLAWAGLAVGLAACETPQGGMGGMGATSTGDARTDAAILAACRQRANEVYDRRNRAEIYAPQYGGNSPLSGTYTDVGVNRGLSAQFAFEQMVRDCVRTANITGGSAGAPPATTTAPATPATAPGARSTSAPAGSSAGASGGMSRALPGAGTALPPPGMGTRP